MNGFVKTCVFRLRRFGDAGGNRNGCEDVLMFCDTTEVKRYTAGSIAHGTSPKSTTYRPPIFTS
jgi:hypothetical protein